MIIIGVDPAFRKDGFWVCRYYPFRFEDNRLAGEIHYSKINSIFSFKNYIDDLVRFSKLKVFVSIENSNLQNVVFTPKNPKETLAAYSIRCCKIGKNMAISQQVYELCIGYFGKENVKSFSPKDKGKKDDNHLYNLRKIKYNIMEEYSSKKSSRNRTNQDQRDAFKLATLLYDELKLKERIRK